MWPTPPPNTTKAKLRLVVQVYKCVRRSSASSPSIALGLMLRFLSELLIHCVVAIGVGSGSVDSQEQSDRADRDECIAPYMYRRS